MYKRYELQEELEIKKLITFLYRELPSSYLGSGEKHDFWELVYVDKGEFEISTDTGTYHLNQGDIIFYMPDEYHVGRAMNNTAPNLVIISFECHALCMNFFAGKSFRLRQPERNILTDLVREAKLNFDPPIDSPSITYPVRNHLAPFGSDQVIRNYLEILLISLIRNGDTREHSHPKMTSHENREQHLVEKVVFYMNEHMGDKLSIRYLCDQFAVSATKLKNAFKATTNMGVMEYYNQLKMNHAKTLIRGNQDNFTEIADTLGYSVHQFSRKFKLMNGMTPTEYARSIKARTPSNK